MMEVLALSPARFYERTLPDRQQSSESHRWTVCF